jgi:uncharacterized protein YndB with AHSA1/START domain
MIETNWTTTAQPAQVWAVLSDGWLYASWVVGASRIRDVDADWPNEGAKIHHSVGAWPLLLDDETKVISSEPNTHLRLLARTRPLGEAIVDIDLTEPPDGAGTQIHMREDAINGVGKIVPSSVRQRALVPRNRESLRRLGYLAEGHSR